MRIAKLGIVLTLTVLSLIGCTSNVVEVEALDVTRTAVQTQTLVSSEGVNIYNAYGFTESEETLQVGGSGGATIGSVEVEVGDEVQKGDLLMKLSNQAQSTIYGNQLNDGREAVKIAQQSYSQQLQTYETNVSLYESGAISKDVLEKSELSKNMSYKDLLLAQSGLDTSKAQLDVLNQNLNVVSPINGVVVEIVNNPGEKSTGKDIIIAQGQLKEINFNIPVRIADKVSIGDLVTIETETNESEATSYSGHIRYMNYESKGLGVGVGVLVVDEGELKSGVFCDVYITYESLDNIYYVPNGSVIRSGDQDLIYIMDNNTAQSLPVEIVKYEGESIVVTGEISNGQKVVIKGQHGLYDGMPIEESK